MSHFHINYSANLEKDFDMNGLCCAIRRMAVQIDTFSMYGIRVGAPRVDHCPVVVSAEMRDINATHYPKFGIVRQYLEEKK